MEDFNYFGRRMRVTAISDSDSLQWASERGPDGWSGLRMQFKADKTGRIAPNKARLTIFNMTRESRAFIESANQIIVEAGYDEQISTWFVGDVRDVQATRKGADVHTVIELGDGETRLTQSVSSVTFTPGATVNDILDRLESDLGIRVGVASFPETFAVTEPLSFFGRTQDILERFAEYSGAWISVQDGELQVTPRDGDTGESAVLLSSDTGMVGSPARKKRVWHVRSLLNPGLRPRRLVEVRSREVSGVGIVRKLGIDLDTHGAPWFCDVEVRFDS